MIVNRLSRLDLLTLCIVALVGLVHLSLPFTGDQAFFTIVAMKMKGGAVLYRDFWDVKQPGIFVFYLLGGLLFGFSEVGVHLFELFYWIGFSGVLLITLRNHFDNRALLSLAPMLTVCVYYGLSGSWHLTQLEALVGFPMFLALRFASEPSTLAESSKHRMFLSGLMGGLVLTFKLLFLPILLSFWLMAVTRALVWKRERPRDVAVRLVLPIMVGVSLPLLIVFCYFAAAGTSGLLFYTYFEYPYRAVSELPLPGVGKLLEGLQWCKSWLPPLTALAVLGASLSPRRGLLTSNLVLWAVVGLGVIIMQRLSWWEYHYMLLIVPLGVLASIGLDTLWTRIKVYDAGISPRQTWLVASLSLTLLLSPVLLSLARKSLRLARHGFAPDYQNMLAEVGFLSDPTSLPGKIYVCGNPLYYYLSGRDPAIPANGWALELFLPEQWEQMIGQLSEARPPYIFVSPAYRELVRERSPRMVRFLEDDYSVQQRSDAGVWYALRSQ